MDGIFYAHGESANHGLYGWPGLKGGGGGKARIRGHWLLLEEGGEWGFSCLLVFLTEHIFNHYLLMKQIMRRIHPTLGNIEKYSQY